jgi:hypothetical protein
MNRLFISHYLGLGDHIVCNAIYREYAKRYDWVYMPVLQNYLLVIRDMLRDVTNITYMPVDPIFAHEQMKHYADHMEGNGVEVLKIGSQGKDWWSDNYRRSDRNFYDQAGIDFNHRWTSFYFPRNDSYEEELFNLLTSNKEFAFIHEDKLRGFEINRKYIDKSLEIVTPSLLLRKYNIFHYTLILEQAKQIHCIESSFGALIESLNLNQEKFAHRYARPEAKNDRRSEFTYKSIWKILN